MVNCTASKSIPELSREQMQELFSTSKINLNMWFTVVPKNISSLSCTPSDSSKFYLVSQGCDKEVVELLGKSFEKIFTARAHVQNYWEDFTLNVTHKLGLTYREIQRMNATLSSYSEARLRHAILNPILKEVSRAAYIIPDLKDETVNTKFLVEETVEMVEAQESKQKPDQKPEQETDSEEKQGMSKENTGKKRGQKPAVDAVIQVTNKDGQVVSFIPIEMKTEIRVKHYSQIACYINRLSTAEEIRGCIMVGILIDKKLFRLAFSVFCSGAVPLPIVHISPPIAWMPEENDIQSTIVVEHSMLTLACTFLVGQEKRIQYDSKRSYQHAAPETSLTEMGKILSNEPHTFNKPIQGGMADLPMKTSKKVEEQQKAIEDLTKTNSVQQEEIKKLVLEVELLKQIVAVHDHEEPKRKRRKK